MKGLQTIQGKVLDQKTDNQKLSILGAGLSQLYHEMEEYGLSLHVYKMGRYGSN